MQYSIEEIVALLAAPATLGIIVAWLVEHWDPFHTLSAFGKKVAMLVGCYALALGIFAVGAWVGEIEPSRITVVETLISASVACYGSQIVHLKDHGKR